VAKKSSLIRKRRLGRLHHYLAELARHLEALAAGHLGGFDEHDVAAHRGVGQRGGHAGHGCAFFDLFRGIEDRLPQQLCHLLPVHHHLIGAALGDSGDDLARHRADLAFKAAHAGLARVVAHEHGQGLVGKL
jgi:hypothetical protein